MNTTEAVNLRTSRDEESDDGNECNEHRNDDAHDAADAEAPAAAAALRHRGQISGAAPHPRHVDIFAVLQVASSSDITQAYICSNAV